MKTADSIRKLRELHNWSQAEFAQVFGVSCQAVQKWEAGVSSPTVANLVAIAKYFNVTVDSLLLGSDGRVIEEMRSVREILPDFANIFFWEAYSQNIVLEYEQSTDEGYDLTAYRDLFFAASKMPAGKEKERICDVLFDIVINAKMRKDYPYNEPSDLEGIRALRVPYDVPVRKVDAQERRKKIEGAWMGRISGCLLGKPLEGIKTCELIPLLKESGNYPMHRYVLSTDISEERCEKTNFRLKGKCWADTVTVSPPDDDTNYTAIGQQIIDRYGRNFTPQNVAEEWMQCQRKNSFCTAERVAFRNIVNGYAPPQTATYKNPYREWIGAQIRGDYFGYINPGDPDTAAGMAWRDACISHVKNGIYGEMYVAAMLACAAVTDDTLDIIRGGLAQIPATSRLYEAILEIISLYESGMTAAECLRWFVEKYDEERMQDYAHTISNAQICTAALLYGGGDFGKSVCFAVQAGFDTDCNGATVGSIVGMQKGIDAIGPEWQKPIGNTLVTTVWWFGTKGLPEVVDKTLQHIE